MGLHTLTHENEINDINGALRKWYTAICMICSAQCRRVNVPELGVGYASSADARGYRWRPCRQARNTSSSTILKRSADAQLTASRSATARRREKMPVGVATQEACVETTCELSCSGLGTYQTMYGQHRQTTIASDVTDTERRAGRGVSFNIDRRHARLQCLAVKRQLLPLLLAWTRSTYGRLTTQQPQPQQRRQRTFSDVTVPLPSRPDPSWPGIRPCNPVQLSISWTTGSVTTNVIRHSHIGGR